MIVIVILHDGKHFFFPSICEKLWLLILLGTLLSSVIFSIALSFGYRRLSCTWLDVSYTSGAVGGEEGVHCSGIPLCGREGEKDHVELLEGLVLYTFFSNTLHDFLLSSTLTPPPPQSFIYHLWCENTWLMASFFSSLDTSIYRYFSSFPFLEFSLYHPCCCPRGFGSLLHTCGGGGGGGGVLLTLGNFFEGERVGIEESPDYRILLG